MWQLTYNLLLALAQAAVEHSAGAFSGPLYGVWVGLYQTGSAPVTANSQLSSLVEANYDGYSRQQAVWFPPWVSTAGPEILAGQDLWFSPTDSLSSNQIQGVFLASAFYGGLLYAGAPLAAPGRTLSTPADALKVQPQFQLTTLQVYGGPAIVS